MLKSRNEFDAKTHENLEQKTVSKKRLGKTGERKN